MDYCAVIESLSKNAKLPLKSRPTNQSMTFETGGASRRTHGDKQKHTASNSNINIRKIHRTLIHL